MSNNKKLLAEILLEDYEKLDEENQYILIAECHDLLKTQQLKKKHLEKIINFTR